MLARLVRPLLLLLPLVWLLLPPASAGTEDILAREWMQLAEPQRMLYVTGVVDGTQLIVKYLGFEFRSALGRVVTRQELSEAVYYKLLAEPELRAGPIAPVVLNALIGPYLTVTDRQGRPIESPR